MESKDKKNSYSHIMKYTGLFGGVQFLNILVGVVRNKLVAIILGPGGMGLVSLFNSTIKLVSESTNLGISMSAVKNISTEVDSGDESSVLHHVALIRFWSLLTGILGFVICVLFSPLLDAWTFSWGDHTLHFVLLSPVIFLMAITGGEVAILKGTRRLSAVAAISFYSMVAVLLMTVPIYYIYGESGIVPSLFLAALAQMLITVAYSFRQYPLRFKFRRELFAEGMGMIKLGIAFVLAGIMGSGADFLIRSFLNNNGGLDIVGLYNAGYVMTFVYAGMVFTAMETDYFPRLSAVGSDVAEQNMCVNRQIEVTLLLVSPLMVLFMVAMPLLLPLLYSGKFMAVTGMMQFVVLGMFVRAVSLPIAYLPLSKGDSVLYLVVEAVYDVMVVGLTVVAYNLWGLTGTGAALALSLLIDCVMLYAVMNLRYGYAMSRDVVRYMGVLLPFALMSFLITMTDSSVVYWVMGCLLVLSSSAVSIYILHNKTSLWEKLVQKIGQKLHL